MNICDPIFEHGRHQPDAPAVIEGDNTICYGRLCEMVSKTVSVLRDCGIDHGQRVGIHLRDNVNHLIAILAVARMGAVVVPIDWRAKSEEVDRLVAAFTPELVLGEAGSRPQASVRTVSVDREWWRRVDDADPATDFPSDWHAPYCIALTSGTTGKPKGTILTHGQQLARSMVFWATVGLVRGDRYLSASPFCFTGTRTCNLFHLINGNTVVLFAPLFTALEYVEAVSRYGITFIFAVPTVHRWLLKLPASDDYLLPNVRILASMGGPLHASEKLEIQRRINPNFYEFYASTGADLTTVLSPGEVADRADSVGRPALLNELEIVDERGHRLPNGAIGRLRCRGPAVATGFFGDVTDPAGNEMFRHGWFYPGELAATDDDGYIYLKGRASELIVRSGINVYPDEIEHALREHPAVLDAAVMGRSVDGTAEEEVVAFVVVDGRVPEAELRTHCRRKLTAHKVPQEIFLVGELPKTASGKIKKSELAARLTSG